MKQLLNRILSAQQLAEGVAWERKQYQPNEIIVNKGDVGRTFFYMEKGVARVTGIVELENQAAIKPGFCDLEAGVVFGEMCLHQSQARMATVVALTDVELLEIDGERFSIYLDDNPINGYLFYKALFEVMANRLDTANQRVENMMAWGLKAHAIDKHL